MFNLKLLCTVICAHVRNAFTQNKISVQVCKLRMGLDETHDVCSLQEKHNPALIKNLQYNFQDKNLRKKNE